MDWLELCVTTDSEAAEAVIELFNRYGHGGAVVEVPLDCFEHELNTGLPPPQVAVKAYLPAPGQIDSETSKLRQRLEEGLWHLAQIYPIPPPTVRVLAEEDWANAWRRQYHTLHIGRQILIVPAWEEYDPSPGEVVIRLEPGMAFGTGLHPTTRLCLQLLEAHVTAGCSVLDVGTGSGVLAIAAAKLGALTVLALDTDPLAVAVARDNVQQNGVADQVTVLHGTLPGGLAHKWMPHGADADVVPRVLDSGQYDLVVANILAPVISSMAPALAARLAPTGWLITSGLIDSQDSGIVDRFRLCGLRVVERARESDWVALVARSG